MDLSLQKKNKTNYISHFPKPENIEPTQLHRMYTAIANKNIKPINGIEFSKFNKEKERTHTPYSAEYIRDNTN